MNIAQKAWWWLSGDGASYSSDANTVFTNIGGTLSTPVKNAIATFVDAEVAAGRWSQLDVFQIWGTALGSESQGLKNWKSSTDFHATNPNGHTATAQGYDFAGSGTSGILTGYNPTTGTNWTATNAMIGIYVRTNDSTADQKNLLGIGTGTVGWTQRTVASRLDFMGAVINAVGTAQKTVYANGWEQGLWTAEEEIVAAGPQYTQRIRKNGVDLGLGSGAVPVELNNSFYIGGLNNSTTPYDGVITGFFAGAKFASVSNFYTNYLTLLTSLGIV